MWLHMGATYIVVKLTHSEYKSHPTLWVWKKVLLLRLTFVRAHIPMRNTYLVLQCIVANSQSMVSFICTIESGPRTARGLVVYREISNCSTGSTILSFTMGMGKSIMVDPIGKMKVLVTSVSSKSPGAVKQKYRRGNLEQLLFGYHIPANYTWFIGILLEYEPLSRASRIYPGFWEYR